MASDNGDFTVLLSYTVPYDSWVNIGQNRSGHPPGNYVPGPGPASGTNPESDPKPAGDPRSAAIVFPAITEGTTLTDDTLQQHLDDVARASLVKLVWEHQLTQSSRKLLFLRRPKEDETVKPPV